METLFKHTYISTTTTTTVKSGTGRLHSIVIGTTAAGSIIVYDNTAASGTIIATLKSSVVEGTYLFDVKFTTGLTIVSAANSLFTVTWL